MLKKDQITFKQLPPPNLTRFLTISQPQNQLIYEHWKHIFTAIEIQTPQKSKHLYLLYKSKAMITFANFQESCLIYQRKFKIAYAQMYQITCLKIHTILINYNSIKKREVIVGIGFFDGGLEIYHLAISQKAVIMKRILSFDCSESKDCVTGIIFTSKNMFVSRLHSVHIYKDCLSIVANIIIEDQMKKQNKIKTTQFKCVVQSLKIANMAQGSMMSISAGHKDLFVFNQIDGAKSFSYDSLEQSGTIIDSITFLREATNEVMVIGDTNDKIKIIYKNKFLIERYNGFRSYCSVSQKVVFQTHEQLWIGDLSGSITYFQRMLEEKDEQVGDKKMKLVDIQVKLSMKVIDSGIKQMRVCGKLLILLDTESNIHLFDIVRKSTHNDKEIQLQSLDQYSSDYY